MALPKASCRKRQVWPPSCASSGPKARMWQRLRSPAITVIVLSTPVPLSLSVLHFRPGSTVRTLPSFFLQSPRYARRFNSIPINNNNNNSEDSAPPRNPPPNLQICSCFHLLSQPGISPAERLLLTRASFRNYGPTDAVARGARPRRLAFSPFFPPFVHYDARRLVAKHYRLAPGNLRARWSPVTILYAMASVSGRQMRLET